MGTSVLLNVRLRAGQKTGCGQFQGLGKDKVKKKGNDSSNEEN